MMKYLLLVLAVTLFQPLSAVAQQEDPDYQQRIELARQMHEIRPLNADIEESVRRLAQRYPAEQREIFVDRMLDEFDQDDMTALSVKAMAETFTLAELEKMIEFHGSPEGQAVTKKMPVYQAVIQPEIIRKIDRAMMAVRTGSVSD